MPVGINKVSRNSQIGGDIPDSGITRTPYNEGSGSTVSDKWDGNDGAINGASWTGSAISPDSSDSLSFTAGDYVDYGTPDDLRLSLNTDRTFVIWMDNHTKNGFQKFAGDYNSNGHGWHVAVNLNGNGYVVVSTRDTDNNLERAIGNTDVADGSAHTIGVAVPSTIDASNFEIYVDGSDDNATASESQGGGSVNNGNNIYTGEAPSDNDFDGDLDDPRWYSKILSATEHSNLDSEGEI